jgi:hypothetical protein
MRAEGNLSKLAGTETGPLLRTLLTKHFPPHIRGREQQAGFTLNTETRDFFFSENQTML